MGLMELMASIPNRRTVMKYLIFGANGLVGGQFVKVCKESGIEFVGTCYSRATEGMRPVDFFEPQQLIALLDEVSPTVVIHSANMSGGVNVVETNPGQAGKLHLDATKVLVDWCRKKNAVFAFFSTDYVFDGKNPPYKEDDETAPLNLYGKLKLESENYIREHMDRYIIARTTNVFGWDPETHTPNFLMYLYQTLREGENFKVPTFLYGNPTYAADLAKAVMELIEKEAFGLFHIVGNGYINRYDWALKFCKIARLDESKIVKVEEPPKNIVPRPFLSNLDNSKVRGIISTELHGVDEGLSLLEEEMKKDKK